MFEKICYKHTFLRNVICRIDFASPVTNLEKSMPKSVYNCVHDYFPIVEPVDLIGTKFQITSVGGPSISDIITKQWVFWSRDKKNRCQINANNVVFTIENYDLFDSFRTSVVNIFKTLFSLSDEIQGRRMGLRYINLLPMQGHKDWISKEFFDALDAHKNTYTMRLITTFEYAVYEKDLNVKLRYGYLNPDYPAVMKNEEFSIDIDAYSQSIIYQDDIDNMIDNMHDEVQSCFEKMITDQLRLVMNTKVADNG